MQIDDKTEFTTLLVSALAIYERQITKPVGDLFFNALAPYTLAQVREGLSRHLQDPVAGKYSPKPADVISQIQNVLATDGRPGKDEAWSIALTSLDEQDTVLLTEEILAALAAARPLLELRDKVAARLAFVEAYERQVSMVRRGNGQAAKWIVSLGEDKGRRMHALSEGVRLGRLTQGQAEPHLLRISQETQPISTEGSAIAGLLAGPAGGKPLTKDELRERWKSLRGLVSNADEMRAEKSMAAALAKRADTERRKQAIQDQVQRKTQDSAGDSADEVKP